MLTVGSDGASRTRRVHTHGRKGLRSLGSAQGRTGLADRQELRFWSVGNPQA